MLRKYFSSLRAIPLKYKTIFESNYNCVELFYNKYIVFDLNDKNSNNKNNQIALRIEEYNDNGFFGTNLYATSKPIGSINLTKNDLEKKLYINWYMINNKLFSSSHNSMYGNPINPTDEIELKRILFGLAESIARENNYDKICLDIHSNLKHYKSDGLDELGFEITNKVASDNPYWIVTEKNLY